MEAGGDGASDSSSSSYSFPEGCPLFETNPRKISGFFSNEDEELYRTEQLELDSRKEKLKERVVQQQLDREARLEWKQAGLPEYSLKDDGDCSTDEEDIDLGLINEIMQETAPRKEETEIAEPEKKLEMPPAKPEPVKEVAPPAQEKPKEDKKEAHPPLPVDSYRDKETYVEVTQGKNPIVTLFKTNRKFFRG